MFAANLEMRSQTLPVSLIKHGEFKPTCACAILGDEVDQIIKLVFTHGGFIAGGFSLMIMRNILGLTRKSYDEDIKRYMLPSVCVLDDSDFGQVEKHASEIEQDYGKGDIDVFFPNRATCARFWRELQQLKLRNLFIQASDGNFGSNILVNNIKIQVIHAYFNTIEGVLAGFDMFNCMAAIHRDKITYHRILPYLESQKILHIARIGPHTFSRIVNYTKRKGYKYLSEESRKELLEYAATTIERLRKDPGSVYDKTLVRQLTPGRLVQNITSIANTFSSEEILYIMAVFPESKAYFDAFRYLQTRAGWDAGLGKQSFLSSQQ